MARGKYQIRGTVSTNADTTLVTPLAGERVYVKMATLMVSVGQTGGRAKLTDGVGGQPLMRMATTTADSLLSINYAQEKSSEGGNALAVDGLLVLTTSATSTASTVDYDICYEVR
jgi:hypothetical protein